jgi:SAM-dependent methyltransferase
MQKEYAKKNSEYLKKNPSWHAEHSSWKATQVTKILNRNRLQPQSIVEIGCGAGEILFQLQEKMGNPAITFTGYDISPDAIELAITRTRPGLSYHKEDLTEKDLRYDVLLMLDVFEHVEDYIGFIRKSAAKATYKIYHIPLDFSVNGILRNIPARTREDVGHLHYFTKDTAIETLQYTDQTIIDYFYTAVSIEVHNKKMATKVLNVIRKIMFKISPHLTVKLFGGYSLLVLTK